MNCEDCEDWEDCDARGLYRMVKEMFDPNIVADREPSDTTLFGLNHYDNRYFCKFCLNSIETHPIEINHEEWCLIGAMYDAVSAYIK